MIYTVTLNPSIDYIVSVERFRTGQVNRTEEEKIFPGGKGINVSIVLKNLGHGSKALGFLAGFTGHEIARLLHEKEISEDFIFVTQGMSRINMKLRSEEESEINGQGPQIRKEEIAQLYEKLKILEAGDILVLAGSIPGTLPHSMYRDIMKFVREKKIHVVVDATKDILTEVLPYHPFLVKPNHHELGEIYGVKLKTKQEVIPYAKKLQAQGAKNVLVSMAGDGAVFLSEEGNIYEMEAPKGELVNSVGAGDSMVAGFVAGYLQTKDYEKAFQMGVFTGSASAFSEELATLEEVKELKRRSEQ